MENYEEEDDSYGGMVIVTIAVLIFIGAIVAAVIGGLACIL